MAETKFLDYAGLSHLIDNIDEKYVDTTEFANPLTWDSNTAKTKLNYTDKFKLTEGALDMDLANTIASDGGLDTDANGKLKVDPSDLAGKTIVIDNGKMEVNVDNSSIKVSTPVNNKSTIYVSLDDIVDNNTVVKDANGKLKAIQTAPYNLPVASSSTLGGIKQGDGLQMGGTNSDVLSVKTDGSTIEVDSTTKAIKVKDGVFATLDNSGKVPSSQLPSFVDDVIEGYYNPTDGKFYEIRTEVPGSDPTEYTYTNEIPGETGKIYVDLSSEATYRYGGSVFVEITSGAYDIITNAEIDALMGIS